MNVELLAPGGSYDSAIAALNAGADAVYTGGALFGARANADNLTEKQLIDVIQYAHIHGKKVYLTVNTLLRDDEIENQLYEYLLPVYENGLDAVIVQDMGVFQFIKNHFPKLHIHASTQMTVFGKRTAEQLKKLGVSRVVMPRELSLKEIKDIHDHVEIEIESFVHGALCYCYSGQCFMSSYIGGRSGNRGRCAQPCRMEYDIIKDGKLFNKGNSKYVLSPKDICTIKILPDIIEAGVYSLKIEGRMKKLEYIAGVVSIYRKYIDLYKECVIKNVPYKVDEVDIKLLYDLFNRNGFSESYYYKHNGKEMISLGKPGFRVENEEFTSYLKRGFTGKKLKRIFDVTVTCKKNQPFTISTCLEGQLVEIKGDFPQKAKNRPVDREMITKQVCKTGGTDFSLNVVKIDLDDDVFMTVGVIKDTRRKFTDMLYEKILSAFKRESVNAGTISAGCSYGNKSLSINVSVSTKEQLDIAVKRYFVNSIYLELQDFNENVLISAVNRICAASKRVVLAMPFVFRQDDIAIFERKYWGIIEQLSDKIDGILIRNIEQYYYLSERLVKCYYIFDYNVYSFNKYAKLYYDTMADIITTLPVELNYSQLKSRGCQGEEFIAYGYMPVMISAGCGLKTTEHCAGKSCIYEIRDKKNNVFKTKCVCKYCYNVMYNCKPLSLFKFQKEISSLKAGSVRIMFTLENKDQTNEILAKAENVFVNKIPVMEDDKSTRGHFNRGVF